MSTLFAFLSFVFSTLAYIPYIKGVLDSKTRPTISAWVSWGLLDAAILVAMVITGDVAYQMVAYVIGTMCVIGVSLWKKASLGWQRLDSICVAIVAVAVAGLLVNPEVSIVLNLVAAVVGSVPMLINTWRDPNNEKLLPWTLVLIGGIFGLLSINAWTIAGASTQVVFAALQIAFFLLICRKFLMQNAPA